MTRLLLLLALAAAVCMVGAGVGAAWHTEEEGSIQATDEVAIPFYDDTTIAYPHARSFDHPMDNDGRYSAHEKYSSEYMRALLKPMQNTKNIREAGIEKSDYTFSLNGNAELLWKYEDTRENSGIDLDWINDVDGDGVSDIITSDNWNGSGKLLLLSSHTGTTIWSKDYGREMEIAGDIRDMDCDGVYDIIIYSEEYNITNNETVLIIDLISGSNGDTIWSKSSVIEGEWYVWGLSHENDFNGDGVNDAIFRWKWKGWEYDLWTLDAISGKDGSIIWRVAMNESFGGGCTPWELPDLNGDEIGDYVASSHSYDTNTGNVTALSGKDGSTIWSRSITGYDLFTFPCFDFNKDGVVDVVVEGDDWNNGTGSILMIDGRDGSTIWSKFYDRSMRMDCWLYDDIDNDGVYDLVVGSDTVQMLSGATGNAIWEMEYVTSDTSTCRDIDGDGKKDVLAVDYAQIDAHNYLYNVTALSGTNGNMVWANSFIHHVEVIPPEGVWNNTYCWAFSYGWGDQNGDGVPDPYLSIYYQCSYWNEDASEQNEYSALKFVMMDGANGGEMWDAEITSNGWNGMSWACSGYDFDSDGVDDMFFSTGPCMYAVKTTETGGTDTTPPTLTITAPADGTTVTTPSITVTGTASDASGIASVTVNGALASGALDWSTWSAEVALVEGENTITVVATDNAGLTTTRTKNVFLEEVSGTVKGIDVSHHQGDIVWSEVYNSGHIFAFVKASEGDDDHPQIIDDHFEINMEEGHDAGVLMGAYHFAHPQHNDAVDEARFFVSVAGEYFKGGYIRPVLDLEEGDGLEKEALSNWIHEFMSTVESETGVEPILYVSSDYANNCLDNSVTKYDLWIAHWTYNPDEYPDTGIWDSWNFWQYSNESSVSGIGGYVDGDLFNGNLSRLNTFVIAGLPTSCAIELREQGTTSTIDEIDVGQFFDICVDGSTGNIKEVRFSSDESQDGNPTGGWTEWYGWDTSSGDWNAETKIKTWSFATGGDKEVWAEIKDGLDDASQCSSSIFVHPGYAIIVAGHGRWWAWGEDRVFDHCANNVYRVLRNSGFDDDHIFYLNSRSPYDIDEDGDDEVDGLALLSNFTNAINKVKYKIGGNPTPFILYLVGHGQWAPDYCFVFDEDGGAQGYLWDYKLQAELNEFSSETPMLTVIGSCYSGGFITSDKGISAENRIVITAATADDQKRNFIAWTRSSDRFWGNLNKGLNVKDSFITDATLEWWGTWIDDNGDKKGHPPDNLEDDGILASATTIGVPGTDDLELTPWYQVWIHSPGELRVYDSQDRVTGLVNGEVKEEIPDSVYDEQDKIVAIFSPSDSYRYEIAGTDNGTYGLEVASVEGGESDTFVVTNVSTTNETTHQYDINWSTLSQGVNMSIDADGDGVFEQNITIQPPVTSFTCTPENPIVNQAITFDATTSYDPDGNITSYDWNFGDGNTTNTTEKMITHSYTSAGDYNVILTVTDDDGAMDSTSKTITINPLRGDLNGDDTLTPTDAAIALQIAVGSRPFDDAADVSRDGKVTSLDALLILQAAAGVIL